METTKVNQELIGKRYSEIIPLLIINEDSGDCCGYSSCDEPSENIINAVKSNNPVLIDCVKIDYENENSDECRVVINFIFEDTNNTQYILGYDLRAGSGSGWKYGAYVNLSLNDSVLAEAGW